MARDEVHLKVVQPIIKGGFHRGSVRYSEAMQLGSNWVVCREFDETHPLSVFLLADPVYQSMQYKRQRAATYTHEGWRVGMSYFEQLAARWNVFLDAVPFVPKYEAETLLKQFCEATGVPEDIAKTEGFVTDPDDPITESGFYDIRLCPTDQNKDMFKDIQVKIIKPGQINGWFRIIGDVNAPYFHEEALTEVPEEDETFFRTLGGMRVHLEAALTDELNDYAAHLASYTWYVMPRTTNIIIPENSFPLLDQDLENRGIPKAVRDKLNELLVGNRFESPTALLSASKPAFEGYTITDEVVNSLQKYVNEGFFPGYFVKNADDGLNALRPKNNNRLQDITYWNTEDHTALENLNNALRETTYRGNNGKYAIRGHRLTKQSLAALKKEYQTRILKYAKEAPPLARDDLWGSYRRFAITAEALEALNAAGMPAELIDQLRPLQDTTSATEEELLAAVEASLGPAPTQQHHDALLTHTAWAPAIYWQGAYRNDLDETITISLTVKDAHKKFRFIPFTRQIKSRVLELKNPPMTGDDVSMLQTVLQSLGLSQRNDPGYAGEPVRITGEFGSTADISCTNRALGRFEYRDQIIAKEPDNQSYQLPGGDVKPVDIEVLTQIHRHWADYLKAFEAYPDAPQVGVNIPTRAVFETWVEKGASELAKTYTDKFVAQVKGLQESQQVECQEARKDLIRAWTAKEAELGHWGYRNRIPFRIILGGGDELGSIGFSQIVNWHKYGKSPKGSIQELNLYHPEDGIRGFAVFSNDASIGGSGGFEFAFVKTGNSSYCAQRDYTKDPYPRIVYVHILQSDGTEEKVQVGNVYTDDAKDRLSKGIMAYNSGPGVSAFTSNIWPDILRTYIPPDDNTPLRSRRRAVNYTITIQQNAGISLRTWTWLSQRIVNGNEKWVTNIEPDKVHPEDTLIVAKGTEVEPGQTLISPGADGKLDTKLTDFTAEQLEHMIIEEFSFTFSEEDWRYEKDVKAGISWAEELSQEVLIEKNRVQ